MDLNKEHKRLFAGKILDFGVLSLITLSFGSLLSKKLNWFIIFSGIFIFLSRWFISYKLLK